MMAGAGELWVFAQFPMVDNMARGASPRKA